ncbi:hypothetical protein SAMN04488030_0046 [Aliiroseovarius halocynthiae]|uniref:Prepilin-type N-terminal cleavage/methylation domain-containing protein n=1 Tax=Aliiroseovarius halocynthiae TaxID=985055 RepID=A0A545SLG4_9RHOB|nr:prepilin-type N-terminal cleavage/methylation domain-containing protein [Aliiroseovarius halocynthiae]TQV65802.1 hypothetical protein FIL88_16015 [Aliiroseovarius halocynthiae]SMR83569.1 hypothetical protein SAMN04488030_0046 [Aliiroseovarius halocynthiae]
MTPRSGYTLLEVLVAFAVMAGVLAVLLPGQSAMLRQSGNSTHAILATDYAQSRLDRLGVSDPLAEGRTQETYRQWRIETLVNESMQADGLPKYFVVQIRILDAAQQVLAQMETVKVAER